MEGPLFIVGAPRSGTSLLYRVLALHPRAAFVNNYNRHLVAVPELAVLNGLASRAARSRRRVWFGEYASNAYRSGHHRSLLDRAFPQPVEGEALFERRRVLHAAPGTVPDARQRRLAPDLERLTRASGGRVLISKGIGHNRRIPLLDAIFPECRFVVMARDGRAVVRSLMSVDWWPQTDIWWWQGTPQDWVGEGHDPVELAARHWVEEVDAIEQGLAGVPRRRVLRLTYEALVRSPVDVLEGVAAFAGLGDDPQWRGDLDELHFPDRNRVHDLAAVDPRVTQIQSVTLRSLGYPA